MTREAIPRLSEPAGIRARWRSRPRTYSTGLWGLMFGLDVLPWPWGENILAWIFTAVEMVRPGQRQRALAWASAQPGRHRWRLAAAMSAFLGRRVARAGLVGMRGPDVFRRHLVIAGEEHLAGGGAILLGFHVGPLNVDLALSVVGHRVAWLGFGQRVALGWLRTRWRPLLISSEHLSADPDWRRWPGLLYRASRILREGGSVYVTADGGGERELFRVPLPGRPAIIRAGWLSLHRHTRARVLPVLTHLDGRTQVVVIHPPLPIPGCDAWQEILTRLLGDYVQRFPEQCPAYAFMFRETARDRAEAVTMPRSR